MLLGRLVAVVVPAYDEAAHVARTVRTIPDFVDDVIVVDDGSRDRTADVALAAGAPRVRVLRHRRNRGVGAAIRSGYAAAFDGGAEVVAVMAGDGQMHPEDLASLVLPVLRGEADYAKGDRLGHPEVALRMPTLRRWGNRVLSQLTRWATGLPVRDSQCGYTALGATAYRALPWEALWVGYGYPNDLLGWLSLGGARVRDVTVRPVYGDERSGIGFRHAVFVVPFVLLRVALRVVRPRRTAVDSACASGY